MLVQGSSRISESSPWVFLSVSSLIRPAMGHSAANFSRSVAELPRIRHSGVGSVKVFSAYLDTIGLTEDQIAEVLAAAAASVSASSFSSAACSSA